MRQPIWLVVLAALATVVMTSCSPTGAAPTAAPVQVVPAADPTIALAPEGPAEPDTPSAPTVAPVGPTATAVPAPPARPKPPVVGDPAYDFALPDLSGRTVKLSDLRGQRVMVNFWATWCGPCRIELPHMVALYQEMAGQGFEILAVNMREAPDTVRPFVDQNDLRFPVLLDPAGQVGGYYFVRAIPTSIFVDENGIITAVHIGTLTDEILRQYVHELMG